jgi:hypothetical protein
MNTTPGPIHDRLGLWPRTPAFVPQHVLSPAALREAGFTFRSLGVGSA